MSDDLYGSCDEVEPRKMPKQATKYDSRPVPMVPEVSLILDKPQQSLKINDSSLKRTPEVRIFNEPDAVSRDSESYAVWKEKQFPQPSTKSPPNNYNKPCTPRNSSLKNNYASRQPIKSHSALGTYNSSHKNQNSSEASTINYNDPRRSNEHYLNKYTVDHSRSCNEIDRLNNSYKSRSHNRNNGKDERRDDKRDYRRDERPNDKREHRANEKKDEDKDETRNEERDDLTTYNDRRHVEDSYYDEGHALSRRTKFPRSSSYSNIDYYTPVGKPDESEYYLKHSRSLQPMHCSPEHSHNCSACCSLNHSKAQRDTETVKNLLQVITSQNEQIKSLQKQLDRLLKLHEQNLKDRAQCNCQSNGLVYQNTQLYDQQSRTANLPIAHNNLIQDNERGHQDAKSQNDKTKQTILEQKVSIGVMTSFELKVQNNPSLGIDSDKKQKTNQDKVVSSLETSKMIKNLVNDTGEMIRKKQNIFTPTTLENISEASESHMSSLRHSHLCSDSFRQSVTRNLIDTVNANYANKNFSETNGARQNADSRRCAAASKNQYIKHANNLDYEEAMHKGAGDNNEDIIYQYKTRDYEDLEPLEHDDLLDSRKIEDFNAEPILNDIIKTKCTKFDNMADDCLSLSSSELDLDEPSPPSPEPSIHVDLQEYSSENGSLPPQRQAKVGWTLYNNVVDQVNQILQNSPIDDDSDEDIPDYRRKGEKKEFDNNIIMDTVKAATLEQLTKLGISLSDNVDQREHINGNKKVAFDESYYPRPVADTHLVTSASIETNTSLHMKALAMKYLNDEQLAELAFQKPRLGNLKQGANNIQNTNMSFATMHYLQRYHLLPGANSNPTQEGRMDEQNIQGPMINERLVMKVPERREPSSQRYLPLTGSSKISYPSKILDISTLKQQPKLL